MSEINVTSQLRLMSSYPLDAKLTPVESIAYLTSIPSAQRYIGMTVTVKSDPEGKQSDYWLVGGINNSNWKKKESDSLEITKLDTPVSTAYSASYQLQSTSSSSPLGDIINIPKDYRVVQSCASTVTTADKEYGGKFSANTEFSVGDRYADFIINTKAKDGEYSHVYLNCKPIVNKLYVEGSGITITSGATGSSSNTISVKKEISTTETRNNGHIEIKSNPKGELYAEMYYINNENGAKIWKGDRNEYESSSKDEWICYIVTESNGCIREFYGDNPISNHVDAGEF